MTEATDKGIDFYDLGSVQKIKNQANGRLGRRAEAQGRWSRMGAVPCRRLKRNVNTLFH